MYNPGNEENIIKQAWTRYSPYWPLFLVLLMIGGGAAWYYIRKTPELYQASATLLIKDEKKGLDDSRMIESLNLISTKKIVENEIEVLKSRSMIGEVVRKLKLYAPVYNKGSFTGETAYSTAPLHIEAKYPDSLTYVNDIGFRYDSMHSAVFIGTAAYKVNEWQVTPFGILKFIPVYTVPVSPEGEYYFSLVNPKEVTLNLIKRIGARPLSKLSTILTLKIKDTDPSRAEDILNQLIASYRSTSIDDKNNLASSTLDFVQQRLNIVGKRLDSIERRIQQYKSAKGAVDIGLQGKLFLESISANDQKVGDMNVQLAVLGQAEKYVETMDKNGGLIPSTMGTDDPVLNGLMTKLYESQLEKEKLRKTTGENSPVMIALDDQISKIKPSIIENIRNQRKGLEASRSNLSATSGRYNSMLHSIPEKERDLVEISRQHNIESSIYAFLLQKREEAALSNSSAVSDSQLIDEAESTLQPVSPKRKLIYLIAAIVALCLGVLIITGKELFTRTIMYRAEIESLTSIPIIGELSYRKTKNAVVVREGSSSLLGEQFRRLRASLGFMGIGAKNKKILVTSSIAGEGKSFLVANLGLTLAMTGKKVVVVEADMIHPSVSAKLNVVSEKGLACYLEGKCEPGEIINPTSLSESLSVIPAGMLPANPSELIMNTRMPVLMKYLDEHFDYILVDTAPVGAMSDAYNIMPMFDATLFVIRHGHTPRKAIEKLDKNNRINSLKNAAIVFNGVRSRGFGRQSYGDGYGYGYEFEKKPASTPKKVRGLKQA